MFVHSFAGQALAQQTLFPQSPSRQSALGARAAPGLSLKAAVPAAAAVTVIVQELGTPATGVQPVHDEKTALAAGDPVSCTVVPCSTSAEQVAPQLMFTP